MKGIGLFIAALLLLPAGVAAAPLVQPSEAVQSRVNVRAGPAATTERLDTLEPGESIEQIGEVPSWYVVRLPDGRTGYVSKAWAVVVEPIVPEPPPVAAPSYIMHVIDVGTGLAIFVEGRDFTLLYDAGSNDDDAMGNRNRVLAYLKRVRPDLTSIDHVVLSHAHKDHVYLLPDIFDAYEIRNVWDSGRLFDRCGYRDFLQKVATEPGAKYHTGFGSAGSRTFSFQCTTGARTVTVPLASEMVPGQVSLGTGAQMDVLYVDTAEYHDPNENSVVVRLDLGSRRFLLTGDAEAGRDRKPPADPPSPNSIEAKLLACCAARLAADLLIAGHHGSMTSSRTVFLDAVRAQHFVISSGPKKYSGTSLPDNPVVEEFQRRGAVWRTDHDDARCAISPAKIGPDADGQPGGCDNIRVEVSAAGELRLTYSGLTD